MTTHTAVLDDVRTGRGFTREPEPTGPVLTQVEVTLLGGFEVRVDGRTISSTHWSRRHSAALIKLLALTPGRSLHREQVMDALWPYLGVDDAAPRLHKAAHYARKSLGRRDGLVLNAETVRLCPGYDVHVDVTEFQRRAESAVANGGIAAAKGAIALYGGELLPQDLYEPWTEQHRQHLDRLHTELLHQAEDWHQVLAADPTDEPAHLALAQRFADRGDRPAALRQLDQLDLVMRHELGLEPSEEALDLRRHVLAAGVDRPCCPSTPGVGSRREGGGARSAQGPVGWRRPRPGLSER
jgi:DNA-binding SARP family transcriptional activator